MQFSLRQKRKRFMIRWRSRQGPWTIWDLETRDRCLYKISTLLFEYGVTANRITLAGFIWNMIWVASYSIIEFKNPLLHLLIFILPIGLSDLLDGSTARNNDDVTPEGTLGDHFRDFFYTLSLGYISLDFGFSPALFLAVAGIELGLIVMKTIAFIWYGKGYTWERFLEFAIDNFQHTSEERWQSNFIYFGFPAYMMGVYFDLPYLPETGKTLVILSLAASFFVFRKELAWTPIPEEKE